MKIIFRPQSLDQSFVSPSVNCVSNTTLRTLMPTTAGSLDAKGPNHVTNPEVRTPDWPPKPSTASTPSTSRTPHRVKVTQPSKVRIYGRKRRTKRQDRLPSRVKIVPSPLSRIRVVARWATPGLFLFLCLEDSLSRCRPARASIHQ